MAYAAQTYSLAAPCYRGNFFRLSIFLFREVRESGNRSQESCRFIDSGRIGTRSAELSAGASAIATVDSGPELEMVKRVASRLAVATGKASEGFDWRESLIRDDKVNAFCLPGGKIIVYTGILPVEENEASLATVLGHEMAHATSRHGAQRVFSKISLKPQ